MTRLASLGFFELLITTAIGGAIVAAVFLLILLVREWRSGRLW